MRQRCSGFEDEREARMTQSDKKRIEELENSIRKKLDDLWWETEENKQLNAIVNVLEEIYNLILMTEGER